ncbi:hypothetical protein GCM10012288_10700 [Malaciobacter pacificus]|jgi:hypothetical protein|uniref:Uncharacterized protein n=1 Tax=Malaciobacter pacificus TaxID=1080223 RepID=A0A5C2HCT0_9BACT|nr:hypothetical protein [Malaciobacter pacificus]QEP35375.1 hypothetical protein APAC_2315 [Malaciobacter pacificus]GGD38529.1 hypothetical protein GCM10012288_10700 [Malaciobacter pacificus]
MERRDWSLKALSELNYIDSLESFEKADALVRWYNNYLTDNSINDFDLEIEDLKKLQELFFKNINFLKDHKEETRQELVNIKKMQQFLKN